MEHKLKENQYFLDENEEDPGLTFDMSAINFADARDGNHEMKKVIAE